MDNIIWSSYGKHKGPLYKGSLPFNPPKPYTEWQKILGVIADCEGKFDTICMHDGTGITAGFMQWTLTSGRLQKFFEHLRTISYPGRDLKSTKGVSIYDAACRDPYGYTYFNDFGFDIIKSDFIDLSDGKIVNVNDPAEKEKINSICLGTTNKHAEDLCRRMIEIMRTQGVEAAQVYFAEKELKQALAAKRSVLGKYSTINNLLDKSWNSTAPALFFNLYQNNPKATFNLFIEARKDTTQELFDSAWSLLKESTFGNWGYNSKDYKKYQRKPRIERIKTSIDKYYGTNLVVQ
jgi:hypothetical protein